MQLTNWQLILILLSSFILGFLYFSPVFLAAVLTPFMATYHMFKNTILYLRRLPIPVQKSKGEYIYHPILNFWMRVINIALYIIGPILSWTFMKFATNDFTQTVFTVRVSQITAQKYDIALVVLFLVVILTTYLSFVVNKPTRNYPYIKDEMV